MVSAVKNYVRELPGRLGGDTWVYAAQILAGLFFIAASVYKLDSFFLTGDQTLHGHFAYWESMGLPPMWFRAFMHWMFAMPWGEKFMEAGATGLQAVAGFLFLINRKTRFAGVCLLFIQSLVFLGTYHHLGFNEFVGLSLWIAVYFVLRPHEPSAMKKRVWQFLTLGIVVLSALYVYNRYRVGDPWISSVTWQRHHFAAEIMPTAFWWKQIVLAISSTSVGMALWASVWWIELLCTCGLLTKYRLPAGAILLLLAILRTLTWINSITSQGVLTVLTLFLWVVQEECMQRTAKPPSQKAPTGR